MPNLRMATLAVTQGPNPGRIFELEQDDITIGRDAANDIVIDAASMSRSHALLSREAGTYVLQDLASTNGTFINNLRLTEPRPLRDGDTLRFGKSVELVFQIPELQTAIPTPTIISSIPSEPRQVLPEHAETGVVSVDLSGETSQRQLVIEPAGGARQVLPLQHTRLKLGRAPDNDIRLDTDYVSLHQAILERVNGGYQFVPLPEANNPVFFQGRPLWDARALVHGDVLRFAGVEPGDMLTLTYFDWSAQETPVEPATISFIERNKVTIGRDPSNTVRLNDLRVSRYHAEIESLGNRYRLRDFKSTNGTFVNGVRVEGEAWLEANDMITIGSTRFSIAQEQLRRLEESGGLRVDALHLNRWIRKEVNLLQDISFQIAPSDFVALVGLSGSGKTTLLDALAGYRPASNGEVIVNGINLYKHFDAVRNDIGYVPQREIIHMELTVFEALDYAARLRMPADVTIEERHRRVDEVLSDLDLSERRDVQVSKLSGGQQKRVSIGVELLTKPGLFFLDEPSSGLDPGTETALMHLLRNLAAQGRTIILITHATKNVMLTDKVIFLVRGGNMAWYGPPNEALNYFNQYRSEREQRTESMDFDKIYSILQDPLNGKPEEWGERFKVSVYYEKYVAGALGLPTFEPSDQSAAAQAEPIVRPSRSATTKRISGLRQFLILSARGLKILQRDRFSLFLMLATAPLLSLLDFIFIPKDIFHATSGNAERVAIYLFFLTVRALFVGALAQMREIIKERDIYKRERLVNLKTIPYVMSKVWVAVLLSVYQGGAILIVREIAVSVPGGPQESVAAFVTLMLASLAGMMVGLLVSAISPTANSAPLLTILCLIPQMALCGGLIPVNTLGIAGKVISSLTSARWTLAALVSLSGFGHDVANDACWQLPKDQRAALTDEQKEAQCTCMGPRLFKNCYFPGLMAVYDPAVDQPKPAEPKVPAVKSLPPIPEFPSTMGSFSLKPPQPPRYPAVPTQRAQAEYNAGMARYLKDLQVYNESLLRPQEAYQRHIEAVQRQYASRMKLFQAEMEAAKAARERYQTELADYQQILGKWQRARAGAVVAGETLLENFYDRLGNMFDANYYACWLYLGINIIATFLVILILQKRKDVV